MREESEKAFTLTHIDFDEDTKYGYLSTHNNLKSTSCSLNLVGDF